MKRNSDKTTTYSFNQKLTDFLQSRVAYIIALIVFCTVPSIISGLQITYSHINSMLYKYSMLVIIFSSFFLVILGLLPSLAKYMNVDFSVFSEYFVMLILLYLLWSFLYFSLGEILWAYVVVVFIIILSILPIRTIFIQTNPIISILYLYCFLWLIYLFIIQTIYLFQGQF